VRVISDDDTALNSGSKLFALAREGIATAVDSTIDVRASGGKVEALARHMHHKFAIVDGRLLLTGSYNWTYSAASVNCENALATDDMFFVERYAAEFTRMWTRFHAKTRRASNVTLLPLPQLSQSMPLRAWHRSRRSVYASTCSLACLLSCTLLISAPGARGGAQDSEHRARPHWPAAVCCLVAGSRARGAAASRQGRLPSIGQLCLTKQVAEARLLIWLERPRESGPTAREVVAA